MGDMLASMMKSEYKGFGGRVIVFRLDEDAEKDRGSLMCHSACMAVLERDYVFAAFEPNSFPPMQGTILADIPLGVATTACRNFLGRGFVFLTPNAMNEPQQSIMIDMMDWKSLNDADGQASATLKKNYLRGLVIDVKERPSFKACAVRRDYVAKWFPALFNVGYWLDDIWMKSGKRISDGDLKTYGHECDRSIVNHPETWWIHKDLQELLLACHFFRWWESEPVCYKDRAKRLAEVSQATAPKDDAKMNKVFVDATCINPSMWKAKRMYTGICKDARMLHVRNPRELDRRIFGRLLSIVRPWEFANHLAKGLAAEQLVKVGVNRDEGKN